MSITPKMAKGGSIVVVNREWNNNDNVELQVPMSIERSRWRENSMAVERGPLVYALKIEGKSNKIDNDTVFGAYNEIVPTTAWNYGLVSVKSSELPNQHKIVQKTTLTSYPGTLTEAPIEIKVPQRS
jgi:DUF1680 family protein